MTWGNLPRTPAGEWWRFVAGAGDYLWARFGALRGLTLEALDCLYLVVFLIFLIFGILARCTFGLLAAASAMPVTPKLNARASANVRSRISTLLRICGEPQVHL